MSAGFFPLFSRSLCHECGSHDASIKYRTPSSILSNRVLHPEHISMQSGKHLNFAGIQNANVIFRCCELYVCMCVWLRLAWLSPIAPNEKPFASIRNHLHVYWISGDSLLPAHHCRVCKMETTITILHTTLHSNVLFRSRVFISKLFIANFLRENEKKWKERRRRGIERREKKRELNRRFPSRILLQILSFIIIGIRAQVYTF